MGNIRVTVSERCDQYTVKPPTSGPPSSGLLPQPGNIFV